MRAIETPLVEHLDGAIVARSADQTGLLVHQEAGGLSRYPRPVKRRFPPDIRYAQDGANGRPKAEIIHRWISKAKRRSHRLERRAGQREAQQQRDES